MRCGSERDNYSGSGKCVLSGAETEGKEDEMDVETCSETLMAVRV